MEDAARPGTKLAVRAWLHAVDIGASDMFPAALHIDAPLDAAGNTALHVAVAAGHLAGVRRLISLGCDLDACNMRQRTPLLVATAHGRAECAMALLEAGVLPEAPRHSPLFEACRHGLLDVARGLIAAGANVNFMNSGGYVPLMALLTRPPEFDIEPLLALLVASGADIHRCTSPGAICDFAHQPNRYRLFLRYGARVSDMDLRLLVNNTALLHVYLEAGGDANAQTQPSSPTLLGLLAQANDHAGLCMALPLGDVGFLGERASPNGGAPLDVAIRSGADLLTFQLLLDRPCSQEVPTYFCLSNVRHMTLLLNGGYDPNWRTPEGYTLVFLAARDGWGSNVEVVGLLAPLTAGLLTERHVDVLRWTWRSRWAIFPLCERFSKRALHPL
ncbi:hypothetical protein SPRG_02789 [Saprolegnia parasitica CBS 223.65]|uniref:Uncharacterized protein n=1 Tax=Saprolegnia parasitica (strain CBS 223.65) TaxID=695850 RepID=A0A067CSU0_SAPPC|nr:hypothetical protein SPRG_02789 [Saprolegnia parasitica CBS 223.65]KDO32310.1 hypothetical protein SPRG_02789 [Saprolegnia parasitica CBS 223.65]|eukprot:XP_012196766.1 hypothetical protein SPRG_02789 [Saprolegnia parasitica CBS 223.65]